MANGILQKLKARREKAALSAEQAYQQLIDRVWSGDDVAETEAEKVLRAAEKTDEDLAKALAHLDKLQSLRDRIVDTEALKAEMRTIRATIEEESKALEAQRKHVIENAAKLEGQTRALRAKMDDSNEAQAELARLTKPKPNHGWEKTPVE